MRALIGIWGGIAGAILLVIGMSGAGGSSPAQAQMNLKQDAGVTALNALRIVVEQNTQIKAAEIGAIHALAQAMQVNALWNRAQACASVREGYDSTRMWKAMDCDEMLRQLEAAPSGKADR